MADSAAHSGTGAVGPMLDVKAALRWAWVCWLVMLVIPFVVSLWVVWGSTHSEPMRVMGNPWFVTAMVYLLLVVPASFFWRGHLFKSYYSGRPVTPWKYFFGMLTIWLALEIGGIFSLVGCFVNNSFLPNLLPALIAFVFYLTTFPNGRAMVNTVGNSEDPATYREPR